MFEPQHPSIAQVKTKGDKEAALGLLPRAQKLLGELQQRLKLGGIPSGTAHLYADGGHIRVQQAMGVASVHLQHPADLPEGGVQAVPSFYPDCAGGLLDGSTFYPNAQTRARMGADAGARKGLPNTHSVQPPTYYSGSLKKLVQWVRGYGQRSIGLWKYLSQVETADGELFAIGGRPYPLYSTSPDFTGDFYNTTGLAFAADGTPWLIQLSYQNGILAGPLPLHPATCSRRFNKCRAFFARKGATDVLHILDWLGGLPTGEGIPSDPTAVAAWIDAGLGVRVKDYSFLDEFLAECTPFHPWMGWAFSETGTRAHNTGYTEDKDGRRYAFHYSLTFELPEGVRLPEGANLPAVELLPKEAGNAAVLRKHIQEIAAADGALGRVMLAKTRMLPAADIATILNHQPAYSYQLLRDLYNPQVSYPAIGVTLNEEERGEMAMPREPRFALPGAASAWPNGVWDLPETPKPLRFGERFTLDFGEHKGSPAPNAPNRQEGMTGDWSYEPEDCDTTFFVYFHGDELVRVKWYLENVRQTAEQQQAQEESLEELRGHSHKADGHPKDEEVAACRFGEHAELANAEGTDTRLAQEIKYAHNFLQPLWATAGFYSTREDGEILADARQECTGFTLEADSEHLTVEPLGDVLMHPAWTLPLDRNDLGKYWVYHLTMVRARQTVFWRKNVHHSLFRCSGVTREACALGKASQEVRLPLRFGVDYAVENPHYAYAGTTHWGEVFRFGVIRRLSNSPSAHCITSFPPTPPGPAGAAGWEDPDWDGPGWDWTRNHRPLPFLLPDDDTEFPTVNEAALGAPTPKIGFAKNYSIWVRRVHFRADLAGQELLPSKILPATEEDSYVLLLGHGCSWGAQDTQDAPTEIIDESITVWYCSCAAQSPVELEPVQDEQVRWTPRFDPDSPHWGYQERVAFNSESGWYSAWNALGDDDTLYFVNLGGSNYFFMEKRGGSGDFPAGSALSGYPPQFCGFNP